MDAQQPKEEPGTPPTRSLSARIIATLRAVVAPLGRFFVPAELVIGSAKRIVAPVGRLAAPIVKPLKSLAASLKKLEIVVRPIKPVWARVAPKVKESRRWQLALAGVGVVSLLFAQVALRMLLIPNVQKDDAMTAQRVLAAWDSRDHHEARRRAEELKPIAKEPQDVAAAAFVLGSLAAEAAAEKQGRDQIGLYALAARHLEQSHQAGWPAGRREEGMLRLGMALHRSGQYMAARTYLEESLAGHPAEATDIHRFLAEAYRQDEQSNLPRALQHCDECLADTKLAANQRDEGLLLRAQICFDAGDDAECQRTLQQIAGESRQHSSVLILESRLLMREAGKLNQGAGGDTPSRPEAIAKYQQAIDMLRQAQGRGVEEMQATRASAYLIGSCLLEMAQRDAALEQFTRVAKMYLEEPEGVAAALMEGRLLHQAGKDDEAIAAYERAISAGGSRATYRNSWLALKDFCSQLVSAYERYAESRNYERALRIAELSEPLLSRERTIPLMADAHNGWADALMLQAEKQSPADREATCKKAREQLRLAGRAYLQAATLRLPTRHHPDDLWKAAQCFEDGRDYRRAIETLTEYLEVEPRRRRPQALLGLGESHLALGHPDKAWAALEDCIQSYPTDAASYRARLLGALTFVERDKPEEAEKLLKENLNGEHLTPASAEWRDSLYALGKLLHSAGRYDEAIVRLDEAVARYPDVPQAVEARYLLAESYRRAAQGPRERWQKETIESARIAHAKQMQQLVTAAVAQYEQVQDLLIRREERSELTPIEQMILRNCCFLRGAALFDAGRYEEAIRAYSIATNRYQHAPEVLDAYVQIASCYRRLNRRDEAHGMLEQAKMVLKRIKDDAPFAESTNFDRAGWLAWIDWMLFMERQAATSDQKTAANLP